MEKGNCNTSGNLSTVENKNRTQSLNVNSLGSKYRIPIVILKQDDKCEEKSDSLKAPDGNWGWIIVFSSFLIQFIIIGKYIVQKFILLSKIVVEYLDINHTMHICIRTLVKCQYKTNLDVRRCSVVKMETDRQTDKQVCKLSG